MYLVRRYRCERNNEFQVKSKLGYTEDDHFYIVIQNFYSPGTCPDRNIFNNFIFHF